MGCLNIDGLLMRRLRLEPGPDGVTVYLSGHGWDA